ncbi:unnamed protein product [Lepeophtheirus salmonis]|uniref:(salmon louse) hypothetical protein n=1 Tax=Lepeophtheirus salmonis TaxID=72036 RepID=A0A7R8CQ25_LEPSM|nr:unnamed protein product [Lepeophtheirus salmonis]CAF2891330.1 unnamed protein product [Lepeophtheirus salmonis]
MIKNEEIAGVSSKKKNIKRRKISTMGCNSSTLEFFEQNGFGQKKGITVGQEVLERFIELEEEIAEAEKQSPLTILQQKKMQIDVLNTKINDLMTDISLLSNVTKVEKKEADDLCGYDTKELYLEQHLSDLKSSGRKTKEIRDFFAVTKWNEVGELTQNQFEERYHAAVLTRNNLIAASQNIQGGQRYLSNLVFPYCTPSEIDTLNKAIAYIFTDMQTFERHQHAMECYSVTSKRCGALLQWINQVVDRTIKLDLNDINEKVNMASKDLRLERVRLIKVKIHEVLGKDVTIALGELNTDVKVDLNYNDLFKTDAIDPNKTFISNTELSALLENDDLAPMPSDREVFGTILEDISKKFLEDKQRFEKNNQENQNRVSNALEKKLASRRVRRARNGVEDKEKEAYIDINSMKDKENNPIKKYDFIKY